MLLRALTILALTLPSAGCAFWYQNPYVLREHGRGATERRLVHQVLGELPPARVDTSNISIALPEITPPRSPLDFEDRAEWNLSLREAVEISLSNADVVRTISGDGTSTAATVYDPARAELGIRSALAAFDTNFTVEQTWDRLDPVSPSIVHRADYSYRLQRNLVTGTQFTGGLTGQYQFTPTDPDSFADYSPTVDFAVVQPLLRGAGIAVNRAPLVIARAQTEQSLWNFKSAMQSMLRSVETAYHNLYASQRTLEDLDRVVELSEEVVRIQKARLEVKQAIPADVGRAEQQLESFRQQRIDTINRIIRFEVLLRNVLGMPPNDERRIVAVDAPRAVGVTTDWQTNLDAMLQLRPDLANRRLQVQIREQALLQARNGLLPQLDFQGLYRLNGRSNELDDALHDVGRGTFEDWRLGFSLNLPLRNYGAGSAALGAELALSRERVRFEQDVHSAVHDLTNTSRDVESLFLQYQAAARQRDAAEVWARGAEAKFSNPTQKTDLVSALNFYLQSLETYFRAASAANDLLARYNIALARLEESKGTLLQVNEVYVSDDPWALLPPSYLTKSRRRGVWPFLSDYRVLDRTRFDLD